MTHLFFWNFEGFDLPQIFLDDPQNLLFTFCNSYEGGHCDPLNRKLMKNPEYYTCYCRFSDYAMAHRSIHWFRKGLRLHDNPAFLAALENSSHIWPVFILDPWFTKHANVGINRWRFLLQTLKDLDDSLKKINSRY